MKNKKRTCFALSIGVALISILSLFAAFSNKTNLTEQLKGNIILTVIIILVSIILIRTILQNRLNSQKYKVIKSTNISFDQIAGMDQVKKEVQIYIDIMKNHQAYVDQGIRIPKGIILEGSPGNGKTLLAKAIATEMQISFIQANAADIGGILVGKGSQDLKKLFEYARKHKPCIVFLDEIDAIGRKRVDSGSDAGNDGNRTVTSLLTELDGFDNNDGIFVIAATNRLDSMDEALIRPGRFDRKITIKNPDYKTRQALIQMYIKNKSISSNVDVDDLAWKLSGFSCAEIENVINEAAIHALKLNKTVIELSDFEQVIIQQRINGYLLHEENKIYKKELTAYHEAGHALVTYALTDDVVDTISIVPTTSQVKGFTLSYKTEDRDLMSLKDIEHRILILMAGRAAEYLFLNEDENLVTTGCSDDMQRAVDLMKLYIKTTTRGISYNQKEDRISESLHKELQELSQQMWTTTLDYCKTNWDSISILAESLIEKKWLTKMDVIDLLDETDVVRKDA